MLRYSAHARLQMSRRNISEEQVELVLQRRGDPEPGSRPTTIVYEAPFGGGRVLKVVVDSVDTEFVVTVFWKEPQR